MKSLYLLFLCSFSTFFVLAQAPIDHSALREEFRKSHEAATMTQLSDDVVVLDSIHSWRLGDQGLFLWNKDSYEYNRQAKRTKNTSYRLDEMTSQFFKNYERSWIYTPFDEYQMIIKSTQDTGPIKNSERYTYTTNPDEDDAIIDSWIDLWDESEQDWTPSSKQVQILKTEELRVRELYRWEESEAAYKLREKNELHWYGEKNSRYERFLYDEQTMQFIPIRQSITEYNSDGIPDLYVSNNWDETLNEWVPFYKFEFFYDVPNHPDYSIYQLDLSNDGQLELIDSCVFILDEEYRYLLDSTFSYDELTQDFTLQRVTVYNRMSDGYLDNIETFTIDDQECVLSFRSDYFYSTITTTTNVSQPSSAPFKLSFENPTRQIQLQLEGAEELGKISFSLYDLNGQILDHSVVVGNTSLNLGKDDLAAGVYLVSASIEQQEYHWKVVVY